MPRTSPDNPYLGVNEVAEMLSLAPDDVVTLIEDGRLRALSEGDRATWRVERASLTLYLDDETEDTRRHALWQQSHAASFPELWGDGQVRHGD